MPRSCLAVVLILVCRAPCLAQATIPAAEPYAKAVAALDGFIAQQVAEHRLPALSVALVDDQKVVWARGYGFSDPKRKTPATAKTVYRVGSVSKLFTDLAVMQLVERGTLNLDEPVRRYLPEFKPRNRFEKAITLRHLMTHRSGLVRESPVGSYFDAGEPSLEKTVKSLNDTDLVYEPGTKTKYSNAGIAVVGMVLQERQEQLFARYLQRTLLAPLGMKSSSFAPAPGVTEHLAKAIMWTYQGRQFPAPTFELGIAPAGCMYSNVLDLSKFLHMLFAGGKAGDETIIGPKTLEKMWTPQFVKPGEKTGFGLGFMVGQHQGKRRIGHGGAIYGFATDLSALPDDKLGVVVIASCDCANAVTSHIANVALDHMLAVKNKKPLPAIAKTSPIPAKRIAELAGRYKSKSRHFDLIASAGRLFYLPQTGFRAELRQAGDALMAEDRLSIGMKIEPVEKGLKIGKEVFSRVDVEKPAAPPKKWLGLIGEYGPDHNILTILEKDGKLHALIEWFFLYPLTEESEDVYAFPPEGGLYHGEKLVFTRDKDGKATEVTAASVVFERRKLDGEDGKTFKIKPLRPVEELRKKALAAKPPVESGVLFRKSDLVELVKLDDSIKLDVRYATTDNFLSTAFYRSAKAFMQRPAAEALVKVHGALKKRGYGLMVHDGYRPWSVTKMFWDATPENLRIFVANPADGSRHNRGCAVDLTLYELRTGKAVEMVGGYDEMSDRSWPDYVGGTSLQRYYRDLLRKSMESEGFTVYEAEWWHFDYKDWRKYPIGNLSFEEIGGKR
jgi:CubicO group peptidase (beta-lactamase class C family)/D-alanyl-D-alanine dipeptidase